SPRLPALRSAAPATTGADRGTVDLPVAWTRRTGRLLRRAAAARNRVASPRRAELPRDGVARGEAGPGARARARPAGLHRGSRPPRPGAGRLPVRRSDRLLPAAAATAGGAAHDGVARAV